MASSQARVAIAAWILALAGVRCSPFAADVRATADAGADATAPRIEDASAEPTPDMVGDAIGNGAGVGATTLSKSGSVNEYAPVTAAAAPTSTRVAVESTYDWTAGMVALVWQVTTDDVEQAGDDVTPGNAGRYGLYRVAAINGLELELDRPLGFAVEASGAQVVSVPEYGDLTVPASTTVSAPAWNGERGGIVAMLVSGAATIDGTLDVSTLGLRGGPPDKDRSNVSGCRLRDDVPSKGYAPKGEGLARKRFASEQASAAESNGPASYGGGGGGGACHNGGGGGGGHGGRGGRGGDTFGAGSAGIPAEGGARVAYHPRERLMLGGGGGAGERNDSATEAPGGAGGGVVFLRARSVIGSGLVAARGDNGRANTSDSGTGGGAGGLVMIDASERVACMRVEVRGGAGGPIDGSNSSPGGGGGSGRIAVARAETPCATMTGPPGPPGFVSGTSNPRGAAAGQPDTTTVFALTPRP